MRKFASAIKSATLLKRVLKHIKSFTRNEYQLKKLKKSFN